MNLTENQGGGIKFWFLILGLFLGTASSFSTSRDSETGVSAPIHAEVDEVDIEVSPGAVFPQNLKIVSDEFDRQQKDLVFCFSRRITGDFEYLKSSGQIIPGLDVPKIIFPFHTFL